MPILSNLSPTPVIGALSHARLSSYRRFFGTLSDAELLGLYAWNEELSASLFRTISLVEIVLRNQFHRQLSNSYGVTGTAGSRDWYLHVRLTTDSKKNVDKVLFRRRGAAQIPRTPVPSPDDVVSKLTFGFWPHLLDATHDTLGHRVPWGNLLAAMLPGHRYTLPSYWIRQKHQDEFFARLDLCNELRNRIAHHEPIWKLGPLLQEARARPGSVPAIVALAPATPADALARLRLLHDRIIELLGWLSPDLYAAYMGSETQMRTLALLDERALRHYKNRRMLAQVDVSRFRGGKGMRQLIRYASRNRQPMHLTEGGASMGHWICPIR